MTVDMEKQYRKVRALLAKANSTTFPGEAKLFREKAEELIKKYGLDEARLKGEPERPRTRSGNFNWADYMRRRESEIAKDMRRNPGNRYTTHQMFRAVQLRREGHSYKVIGQLLGIKATAHLAKTLREEGWFEDRYDKRRY
jgi:hypothetical protein